MFRPHIIAAYSRTVKVFPPATSKTLISLSMVRCLCHSLNDPFNQVTISLHRILVSHCKHKLICSQNLR